MSAPAMLFLIGAMLLTASAPPTTAPSVGRQGDGPPGAPFRDCPDVCPEMVLLPAGSFKRGAPPYMPHEAVVIDRAFAIGRYAVTVGEYGAFIRETGRIDVGNCQNLRGTVGEFKLDPAGSWRDPGFEQTDRHPVVCVNHADARAYAEWLSKRTGRTYRLPTEQEWEYAARAGLTTDFIDFRGGAEDICKYANIADASYYRVFASIRPETCDDGYLYTSPVGSYPPNGFGLYDMIGNVSQWTASPSLMRGSEAHMARGGSWFERAGYASFFMRPAFESGRRQDSIGFRVVREAGPRASGAASPTVSQ